MGCFVLVWWLLFLRVSFVSGQDCWRFWFILLRRNLMQGQSRQTSAQVSVKGKGSRSGAERSSEEPVAGREGGRLGVSKREKHPCSSWTPAGIILFLMLALPRRSTEFNVRPKVGGCTSSCTWQARFCYFFFLCCRATPTRCKKGISSWGTYLATLAGMHAVMETGGLVPANATQHRSAIEFCK